MIVDDLYVVSVSLSPHKTNAPLVIDTDAVLPFAVSCQCMKPIAARDTQIHQTFGRVQHQQFPSRRLSNIHEPWDIFVIEKPPGVGAFEGLNHILMI
jgi:hypothetical protein